MPFPWPATSKPPASNVPTLKRLPKPFIMATNAPPPEPTSNSYAATSKRVLPASKRASIAPHGCGGGALAALIFAAKVL